MDPKDLLDCGSQEDDKDFFKILDDLDILEKLREDGAINTKAHEEKSAYQDSDMADLMSVFKLLHKAERIKRKAMAKLVSVASRCPSIEKFDVLFHPISSQLPIFKEKKLSPVKTSPVHKYKTETKSKRLIPAMKLKGRKKFFTCTKCGFVRASWGAVNGHILSVHENRVYRCDYKFCSWESSNVDSFRRHLKEHTCCQAKNQTPPKKLKRRALCFKS